MIAGLALSLIALLQGDMSAVRVRATLADKFNPDVLLDFTSLHSDISTAATVCGQVEVNRRSSPIKFIADTSKGLVWLESSPMGDGANSPVRRRVAGLMIGGSKPLEDAWRRCNSGGTALPLG
jgi:hypothetical protein